MGRGVRYCRVSKVPAFLGWLSGYLYVLSVCVVANTTVESNEQLFSSGQSTLGTSE